MLEQRQIMTLSGARERHAGKWLALEVISRDGKGRPDKVRVVSEAGTRLELREKIRTLSEVYIAFAGPVVPAGQGILY